MTQDPKPVAHCKDCDDCARRAHSDATTPGFFYDKCELHRKPQPIAAHPDGEPVDWQDEIKYLEEKGIIGKGYVQPIPAEQPERGIESLLVAVYESRLTNRDDTSCVTVRLTHELWREIQRFWYGSRRAVPVSKPSPEIAALFKKIMNDTFDLWDSDQDMKVGKRLRALSGGLKGYDPEITRLLDHMEGKVSEK